MTKDEKRLFNLREASQACDQGVQRDEDYGPDSQVQTEPDLCVKDLDESLFGDIPVSADGATQTPRVRRKLLGIIYILLTYICLHGIITLFYLRKYHSLVLQKLNSYFFFRCFLVLISLFRFW